MSGHQVVTWGAVAAAGFWTLGSLAAFLPDAPGPETAASKVSFVDRGSSTAAVNAVTRWLNDDRPAGAPAAVVTPINVEASDGQWLARVQADVNGRRSCWTVRVDTAGVAQLPPLPAGCLPSADEAAPSSVIDTDTPETRAAAQFAEAWITGGPVDRFLAPGFGVDPIVTHPDASLRSVRKDGDHVNVSVDIPVAEGHSVTTALSVRMQFINDQWMVAALTNVKP